MSPANIELLAEAFAGWGKGRPANMRELLHPDCVLEVPDSVPYGGTFRGADAAIAWFTDELWRWFDEFTSTPEDFIDAGDRIVLPVHVQDEERLTHEVRQVVRNPATNLPDDVRLARAHRAWGLEGHRRRLLSRCGRQRVDASEQTPAR